MDNLRNTINTTLAPQGPPVPRTPVVTLRFQGGPPPPHPPVTEPTPHEEYQMAEAQRQAAIAQRDMAQEVAEQAPPPPGQSGGFFKIVKLATSAANTVTKAASNVHAMGEEKVRALLHQQNQDRFERNFPELHGAGEQLITDFSCKVMSQGQKVAGNMQVTTRHICFTSDTLRDLIPYQEIASIQRSIALETVDNGPPFIMPVPAPHVVPDTLQIFTTTGKVYQFLSFESHVGKAGQVLSNTVKGKPIDRCYNFMDHAWRAGTTVPLPGIQYAQY